MPRTYTILLAEDDPVLLEALRQAVAGVACDVVEAVNGADVLLKAHARRPDLIVLDRCLPVLDGLRTLELLRGDPATRGIPIVMVGGDEGDEAVARALGAGASFYLRRPLELQEVRAIIARLLLGQ